MSTSGQIPDFVGDGDLSVAVIGPNEQRRNETATTLAGCEPGQIQEFASYPDGLSILPELVEASIDVVIIDLDSDPDLALELIESICANCPATVMVHSAHNDPDLMVRCMRAGAREFLTLPLTHNKMAEALVRVSAHRPATSPLKKTNGRVLVFFGAKGGSGVTTLACNYAVSLAHASGQKTLLIDLNILLGDAAINLGIEAKYSIVDALQNSQELDSRFLFTLLARHSCGLYMLAAPNEFTATQIRDEAFDKLLEVARQTFDFVVIDAGSRFDMERKNLFAPSDVLYLVTQVSVPELRNSNRLISQLSAGSGPNMEIVINRYQARSLGISDEQITKALTRPPQWKVPNDYPAVLRMQNTAAPLALEESPISRAIQQMARSAFVPSDPPEKKRKLGFGW